jgi:hypothetical protein
MWVKARPEEQEKEARSEWRDDTRGPTDHWRLEASRPRRVVQEAAKPRAGGGFKAKPGEQVIKDQKKKWVEARPTEQIP